MRNIRNLAQVAEASDRVTLNLPRIINGIDTAYFVTVRCAKIPYTRSFGPRDKSMYSLTEQ